MKLSEANKESRVESTLALFLSISRILCVNDYTINKSKKGDSMAKGQDSKKAVKKAPTKTLKEKRTDKNTKKS